MATEWRLEHPADLFRAGLLQAGIEVGLCLFASSFPLLVPNSYNTSFPSATHTTHNTHRVAAAPPACPPRQSCRVSCTTGRLCGADDVPAWPCTKGPAPRQILIAAAVEKSLYQPPATAASRPTAPTTTTLPAANLRTR